VKNVASHVVQQPRLHADQVHLHVSQEVGDHERMHHVGLAGIADLQFVMFRGEAKGLLELGEIVARPRFMRLGDDSANSLSTVESGGESGGAGGDGGGGLPDSDTPTPLGLEATIQLYEVLSVRC